MCIFPVTITITVQRKNKNRAVCMTSLSNLHPSDDSLWAPCTVWYGNQQTVKQAPGLWKCSSPS